MRPWKILLLCLLSLFSAHAQNNKKAIKYYKSALTHWSDRELATACKKMELAIKKDPLLPEPYGILGKWYFEMHEFPKAANVFRNGYLHSKFSKKRFAKPFAKCLIYIGKPDSALLILNTIEHTKDSQELHALRMQALFAKQAYGKNAHSFPVNLGIRVNTKYAELFPYLSPDMQTLYFTRRYNKFDQDIFQAVADTCGGWLRADNVGVVVNSPNEETSPCISADGHYMFFTRCQNKSEVGWDGGGCDLYMSYRTNNDSSWYLPEAFGATINTPAYEGMPSLSPDNRELYFVSDRPGGYGGLDIWIARFEDGLWQLPVNAGPDINTAGNEVAPFIDADNSTLYFSSDGHVGMGGYDIFMSRKRDTQWTKPENLGYPLNTEYDEVGECVGTDGKKIFFASDRYTKAGNFDIYEAELSAERRPNPVKIVRGHVYDSLTKERLNSASMYVVDMKKGDTIFRFQSNRGDGSFQMPLHNNNTYAIHTARLAYTAVDDTLVLGDKGLSNIIDHNIAMLPSDYVKPILDSQLAVIHFDLNKVALTDADKETVKNVVIPWMLEKGFVIHVNGYTDNTGNPMINEELSTKRAKLIAKEIISLGVDELMVEAHGWGEAKMIAPNDNDQNQRKNRRVEISLSR